MRILVVEDHQTQLKLARHVLAAGGHETKGAGDAEAAFEAIQREAPELVLVDLALPGMDGLQLVRKLKASPATAQIPVVAITSYPEKFPRDAALEAGCDEYIVKPMNTRTLPGALATIAQGKLSQDNPLL